MGYKKSGRLLGEYDREAKAILPWFFAEGVCHLCSQAVKPKDAYVYWAGNLMVGGLGEELEISGGAILLHPHCARELAQHLIKDSWLAENLMPEPRKSDRKKK